MKDTLTAKQQNHLEHIKTAMASGMTLTDYAKKNDLDVKALYNWKSDFVRKGLIPVKPKAAFTKVATKASLGGALHPDQMMTAILPNGIEIRFDKVSPDALQALKSL